MIKGISGMSSTDEQRKKLKEDTHKLESLLEVNCGWTVDVVEADMFTVSIQSVRKALNKSVREWFNVQNEWLTICPYAENILNNNVFINNKHEIRIYSLDKYPSEFIDIIKCNQSLEKFYDNQFFK
jgi:hypothetical protein